MFPIRPPHPTDPNYHGWPQFPDLFNGIDEVVATILSICESLWEYCVILVNGAISLFKMAISAIVLPFQAFTWLPALIASACACFLAIAIIKTLSGGKAT